MTKASKMIVLATASFLGSTLVATAQTPAGGADAGLGADATRAQRIEQSRGNREPGVTTGSVSNGAVATEQPGVVPPSPTGAPVPNAAISKPPADAAAPAGR